MLPNWLYGKSKSKLAELLGGGGAPSDYNQVKAQVTQNTEGIASLDDTKAALTQITNPNLLDNPWFTVNQRGQTAYENLNGNAYSFDRWRTGIGSGATQGEFKVVQNSDGSISLVNNSSIYCNFVQPLENSFVKRIHGKTVTLSIRFADDTVLHNSGVVDASINAGEISVRIDDGTNLVVRCYGDMTAVIQIAIKSGVTISNIRAIKLELGSVSTLAMDAAPNYTTELLKCQRYFHKYATEALRPSNMYDCVPEMRATPTQSTITIDSTTYYTNSADL